MKQDEFFYSISLYEHFSCQTHGFYTNDIFVSSKGIAAKYKNTKNSFVGGFCAPKMGFSYFSHVIYQKSWSMCLSWQQTCILFSHIN
jgi:hypothetical protein